MNVEIELLKLLPRLFDVLNALIENYGIYFYLVFVWLALATIVWIAGGGLPRTMKGNAATVIPIVIIVTRPPRQPEPPVVDIEVERTWSDDEEVTD